MRTSLKVAQGSVFSPAVLPAGRDFGGTVEGLKSRRAGLRALRYLLVVAGGLFLASCLSNTTYNNLALPVVTLSPASATVVTEGTLQFTATVVSPTSTTLTWSVNGILGGNSTVGTVSSSGLYTAPASVPSPASVTVTATSSAETNPTGSAMVTITAAAVHAQVTISPLDSSTPASSTVQFVATVTGTTNTAVEWSVNGVGGGNSTVGTITSGGLYTAPASLPSPATVVVTATSLANTSQSASTTVTLTASNTTPLFVNFGPNGNTNNPETAYYNGIFTSVTVCLRGTQVCQTIPDVLVDTGSVGLRILNSQLTAVPSTLFQEVRDSAGNEVQECVQFGDTSYVWGPVVIADVTIAGETASSVPFQVIGGSTFPVPASSCLSLGLGPSDDTVQALGANGILGIGTTAQDCGLNCAGGQTFSGYPYYVCPKNVCQTAPVPVAQQVTNPVSLFAKDNNGVLIVLPSISSAGASSLPYTNATGTSLVPAGLLVFGIGTESNNALGSATIYAADSNGNFSKVVYKGSAYNSGGFLDTGSNALYILNPLSLGITDCSDNSYYCPSSLFSLSLTNYGANGTSGTITLNIANADLLFSSNPSFAAFNNLGGASGTGMSTDYFDLGMPFFFGRSVFIGLAGTNTSAPNGYFAF